MHVRSASGASEKPKAVMVYVHGGGFFGGTGALYNLTAMAAQGVVAVAVGYRSALT